MKKLFMVFVSLLMCLSLVACSNSSTPSDTTSDEKVYNVAIIKLLDHASMDEIAGAVAEEFDALAAKNGVKINYEITSGQLDESTIISLVTQAIGKKYDAIVPIATLTAQIAAKEAEATKTPVVFAAVSDPTGAELLGLDYVTGTSDALNTEVMMDMMFAQNPDIKKVGLLYSLSEINSETPIAEAKAYLNKKGVEFVEKNGDAAEQVMASVAALIASGVDAVFTPTDNVVMASELSIAPEFIKAGIPHYAGADSFVRNGGYATCGVDYTDLGHRSADLAYEAMTVGMSSFEDFYLMDGGIVTVNTETASALGLDYSCFKQFGSVVEVLTTEE